MKITSSVQKYIRKISRGQPFTSAELLKFGGRAAIDQALSRLTKSGMIVRLARGVFVRPEENRIVGQVLPEPYEVVQAIANRGHEIVQVSGAEAARQLGLSTQVPAQPVFFTTGTSRRFKIDNLEVSLKHVSRKKIPLPESKAGLAISALWYLGKEQVAPQIIKQIEKKLTSQEFEKFLSSREQMPVWMSNTVLQYEKIKEINHA